MINNLMIKNTLIIFILVCLFVYYCYKNNLLEQFTGNPTRLKQGKGIRGRDIEKKIDRLDSILPPLKNFVVPSGNKLISQIHICRSITRRCERRYVSILNLESKIELIEVLNIPMKYLNRLSDYLFVLSRFVAMTLDIEEDLFFRNFTK